MMRKFQKVTFFPCFYSPLIKSNNSRISFSAIGNRQLSFFAKMSALISLNEKSILTTSLSKLRVLYQ